METCLSSQCTHTHTHKYTHNTHTQYLYADYGILTLSQLTGERDCSGAAKGALAQAGGEEAEADRARQQVLSPELASCTMKDVSSSSYDMYPPPQQVLSLELASCTMQALNAAHLVSSTGVVKLEVKCVCVCV